MPEKKKKAPKPTIGTLLISEPMMADPNFRRSIVLICDHNEEGTFGLVLNDTLPHMVSEVLDYNSSFDAPLRLGGPCEPQTLHVLHAYDDLPESQWIADGLYWGADFEELEKRLALGILRPEKMVFFLGYSGWSAGQLEREIQQKDWFLTTVKPDWVFAGVGTQAWRQVLRQMGGPFGLLANFPDDPRLN
ncbi:MAG: YqgE/AlgH family protein [Bacteroidetes Order II. Incertae sedis bacterium]|nr:YqgE/AlgH family protein [Bacteroidetes Order II. bacterium]